MKANKCLDVEWHTPRIKIGSIDEQVLILSKLRRNLKKGSKNMMSLKGANNFNISESDETSSKSSQTEEKKQDEDVSKGESDNSLLKPLTPQETKRKKSANNIWINVMKFNK